MVQARDIKQALGGSRLFEQPQYIGELRAYHAALARPPVLLEVGFELGRRLLDTAARNPDWTVIGLEVRREKVRTLQARAAALPNLLAWRADARTVLALHTPADSLAVVEILFPTPWLGDPRLLVTPELCADVARALRPGGLLLLATDVAPYAAAMAAALESCPELEPDPRAGAERPACVERSRRQWRCAQDGSPVYSFAWRRR